MVNIIGQHVCYQAQRYHVFSLVNYVAFGLLCGRVFVLRFSLHQESSYDVILCIQATCFKAKSLLVRVSFKFHIDMVGF